MAIRKVVFALGEYYHIYNRGNSKQKIFHDTQDYRRFLALLYSANTEQSIAIRLIGKNIFTFDRVTNLVSIGAYCLMPNHFHILITQTENGSISKFMQKVTTGYSMYYNQKYKRTGSLFEGRFKSEHADTDRYLKYLFSYIHLNPIKLIEPKWKEIGIQNKKHALDFLRTYLYSSYYEYIGQERPEQSIIDRATFPDYFPDKKSFEKEVFEWLSYGDTV